MTSAYFENMVESFEDSEFQSDIPFAAINMLKKALDNEERSTKLYVMNVEEENSSDDGVYWRMSCEATERAKGLLDAYHILTNRKVICSKYNIKEEIEWINETFSDKF